MFPKQRGPCGAKLQRAPERSIEEDIGDRTAFATGKNNGKHSRTLGEAGILRL